MGGRMRMDEGMQHTYTVCLHLRLSLSHTHTQACNTHTLPPSIFISLSLIYTHMGSTQADKRKKACSTHTYTHARARTHTGAARMRAEEGMQQLVEEVDALKEGHSLKMQAVMQQFNRSESVLFSRFFFGGEGVSEVDAPKRESLWRAFEQTRVYVRIDICVCKLCCLAGGRTQRGSCIEDAGGILSEYAGSNAKNKHASVCVYAFFVFLRGGESGRFRWETFAEDVGWYVTVESAEISVCAIY